MAIDTSARFLSRKDTSLSFVALEKSIKSAGYKPSTAEANHIECWFYDRSRRGKLTVGPTSEMNTLKGINTSVHQSPYLPKVIVKVPYAVEFPKADAVR